MCFLTGTGRNAAGNALFLSQQVAFECTLTGEERKARDEVRKSPGEGTEQKLFCKVENKIRIKAHLNYIYQRIFVNFMCFFFFNID